MSKELNKWLDEFVENGADPTNVSDWSENVGGGEELIILEGVDEKEYTIIVDEILKLVENVTNTLYKIGDIVDADDSGESVDSCITLSTSYSDSKPSGRNIWMNGDVLIASITESSFSSWYDFINDNRAAIEAHSIPLKSGSVFVGVIRSTNQNVVGTFNISNILREIEE